MKMCPSRAQQYACEEGPYACTVAGCRRRGLVNPETEETRCCEAHLSERVLREVAEEDTENRSWRAVPALPVSHPAAGRRHVEAPVPEMSEAKAEKDAFDAVDQLLNALAPLSQLSPRRRAPSC